MLEAFEQLTQQLDGDGRFTLCNGDGSELISKSLPASGPGLLLADPAFREPAGFSRSRALAPQT
jgi:23S rRNA A2030 N6-methylase RlmJ